MYKACIFDLDGTLVDSLADLAASANHAMEVMGLQTFPTERYRYFVGSGVKIMVEKILTENGKNTPANVEKAVHIFDSFYAEHFHDKTGPYDGVPELLNKLKKNGLKTAVVSNKPDGFVKKIIRTIFGEGEFDAVIGQRDGVPIKPDPTGALDACRLLGAEPADCVFIGDSSVDMKTAGNAGMTAVGVLWGFRTKEELIAAGSKFLLEKPAELLHIIN